MEFHERISLKRSLENLRNTQNRLEFDCLAKRTGMVRLLFPCDYFEIAIFGIFDLTFPERIWNAIRKPFWVFLL